jgi:hypothetical protein
MKKFYSFLIASLFSVMLVTAAPTTGLQFSGIATSYIDLGQQTAFNSTQFTIEAWVNFQSLTGAYIISTEGSAAASGGNQGFVLRVTGTKLQLSLGANNAWPNLNSTTDILVNTWYHVAATYSGTEINLYINGVLDASTTITTPMVTSVQNLCIGEGSMWKNRLFIGKMADLRFWNVVLSATDIAGSMSTSLTGKEAGLVADWKMNEGAGAVVADATGTYNITKSADVAWFDLGAGVNPVYKNSSNIESVFSGRTLSVTNKTTARLHLTIYSISGQQIMTESVNAGNKFEKQLSYQRGSYILNCVSEDGSTYTEKIIISE